MHIEDVIDQGCVINKSHTVQDICAVAELFPAIDFSLIRKSKLGKSILNALVVSDWPTCQP